MAPVQDPRIDPLTTTLTELQGWLDSGSTTSVQILEGYLRQIRAYNKRYNAFISLAPEETVLGTAARLDQERAAGRVRGPLHGIPIVIKDCITTDPELGMTTTLGSWAFLGSKAKRNSAIAQKLVDAGMIIVGKGNMTEFCGMKTTYMMPGWSAHGGQTISPYVGDIEEDETILGHSAPGGSSTGPAVAVSAGFAPVSLGTETVGSIVTPATRQGLYALKPTCGAADTTGVYGLASFFDSVGPMAKSPRDLIPLLELLLGRALDVSIDGAEPSGRLWEGVSVGFADPQIWKMVEAHCRPHEGTAEQMVSEYNERVSALQKLCGGVQYPIEIPDASELTVDGNDAIMPIAFWEFKNLSIPNFIQGLAESPVHSLADIVEFNEHHKEKTMPHPYSDQCDIIKALDNTDTEEHVETLRSKFRPFVRNLLEGVFEKHHVNLIAAPGDSPLCIHAAAAGYPLATLPMGALKYNGRPFGLCVMARADDEETLLRFLLAYEQSFPGRPVPSL